MKEYIERAPLLERLYKVKMDEHGFGLAVQFGINHAINCIKEAPAAGVADVVRCDHCERRYEEDGEYFCSRTDMPCADDDFCSYGQRKIETVLPKSDVKDESLEDGHEVS